MRQKFIDEMVKILRQKTPSHFLLRGAFNEVCANHLDLLQWQKQLSNDDFEALMKAVKDAYTRPTDDELTIMTRIHNDLEQFARWAKGESVQEDWNMKTFLTAVLYEYFPWMLNRITKEN